jgi:hypothetical protein
MQFRTQAALISKDAPEMIGIEKMVGLFLLKLPASEAGRLSRKIAVKQPGSSLNAGGINYGTLRQEAALKLLKELETMTPR